MKKFLIPAIIFLIFLGVLIGPSLRKRADIVVGSKHFTEQKILAEIIGQLIEARTGLTVRRRIGLQGTKVCFNALREGELDIYPEYTGTGLVNILEINYDPSQSRDDVLKTVRTEFEERWALAWLSPMGFDNTYAFAVRERDAEKLGVTRISDLQEYADTLQPGFDHEFTTRPEYNRFERVYGFTFEQNVTHLDPDLTYEALKEGLVDIIDAFSTDGRIAAYNLRVLEDDKHLFPPYDACVLIRQETLDKYPNLKEVLSHLSGAITPEKMQEMNYAVSSGLRSRADVANEFLSSQGLIPSQKNAGEE